MPIEKVFPSGSVENKVLQKNPFSAEYNIKGLKDSKAINDSSDKKEDDTEAKIADMALNRKYKGLIDNVKNIINDTITSFDEDEFEVIIKKKTKDIISFVMILDKNEFYKKQGFILIIMDIGNKKIRFVNKGLDHDEFEDIAEDIRNSKDFAKDMSVAVNDYFRLNLNNEAPAQTEETPTTSEEPSNDNTEEYINMKDFGLDDVSDEPEQEPKEEPAEKENDDVGNPFEMDKKKDTKKEEVEYQDPEEKKKDEKKGKVNEDKENFKSKKLSDDAKKIVRHFMKKHPKFKDEDLHEFAEKHKLGIHDVESYIYSLKNKCDTLKEAKNTILVVTIDDKNTDKFEKLMNVEGYFFDKKEKLEIGNKTSYYFPDENPTVLQEELTALCDKNNIMVSFNLNEKTKYNNVKQRIGEINMNEKYEIGEVVRVNMALVESGNPTYYKTINNIVRHGKGHVTIVDIDQNGTIRIAESLKVGSVVGGVEINSNAISKADFNRNFYENFNVVTEQGTVNNVFEEMNREMKKELKADRAIIQEEAKKVKEEEIMSDDLLNVSFTRMVH